MLAILIGLLIVFGPLLVFLWILGVIIFPLGDALDKLMRELNLKNSGMEKRIFITNHINCLRHR